MVSLDISKAYGMSWRTRSSIKPKTGRQTEEWCVSLNYFMKERTLRVAVGNTLSNEAAIKNGIVQETPVKCHVIPHSNV
jgi:hypothetical protein